MMLFSSCATATASKQLPAILACDQSQQRIVLLDSNTDWSSKVIAYGYAGGSTHSTEILPDGLIVTASSNGNLVQLFDRKK